MVIHDGFGRARILPAGSNEIYRWGKKCERFLLMCKEPNKNGYINLPTELYGHYWAFGTSKGKYGWYARINNVCFSVNSLDCIYAKAGTEKGDLLLAAIDKIISFLHKLREGGYDIDMLYDYLNGQITEEELNKHRLVIDD